MTQDVPTAAVACEPRAQSIPFEARFDRCRSMLLVIASRVLGGMDDAARAVANCRRTAALTAPASASEPAFRSWLARVLIDEALAIVRRRNADSESGGRISAG